MGRERPQRFARRRATEGTGEGMTSRLRLTLTPGVHAAGTARRALELLDGDLDPQRREDLRLLVTELVTNAVRHANAPAEEAVMLEVAVSEDRVRVEVRDAGRRFERAPRPGGQDVASGWGLHLVERLSDDWGVASASGTCVWFEMSRATSGRPPLHVV